MGWRHVQYHFPREDKPRTVMSDQCRERILTAIIHENEIQKGAGISGGRALIANPVNIGELIEKINAVC